jgi:hypothetical protein
MKNKELKYIATQISAPVFAFLVLLSASVILKHFYPLFLVAIDLPKVLTLLSSFLFVIIGSMALWGRILVILGVLTKGEAKGYPWRKSWEKKDALKGSRNRVDARKLR